MDSSASYALVVEDDRIVADLIEQVLTEEGYDVRLLDSLFKARGTISRGLPDIVILDRRLPDGDGIEFCRELRAQAKTQSIPVLFLTAKKGVPDRVLGLESGADDYLTKPFSPEELLARIRAILRRTMRAGQKSRSLTAGPIRIDAEGRRVFVREKELSLWPKEYNLLLTFMESPNRALSRPFLLESAWGLGKDLDLNTNVVDVTVGNLRKKLGSYGRAIVAVRGVGFRFDPESLPQPPAPPRHL